MITPACSRAALAPVGALLAALALAGCASSPHTGHTAARRASPTTTVSASPSASPTPLPSAADGTDYAACEHGSCEVAVQAPARIPVGGSLGPGAVTITRITATTVEFTTHLPAGDSSGSLAGYCTVSLFSGGGGSSCPEAPTGPPTPRAGVLALQLVCLQHGTAILRLVSG